MKNRRGFVPIILSVIAADLIVLTITTAVLSYRSVFNENINVIRQQNNALVNRIEGWLSVRSNQLLNNMVYIQYADFSDEMRKHVFTVQENMDASISMIMWGRPDGTFVHGGVWEGVADVYAPHRVWYIEAAQTPGEIVFLRPYMGPATRRYVFAVARTVNDHDTSEGVIAMSMPFVAMQEAIAQNDGSDGGLSFVLDRDGYILFHPNPAFNLMDDEAFHNIRDIEDGRFAGVLDGILNDGFYFGDRAVHVGEVLGVTGWYVITQMPISYIYRSIMPTLVSLVLTAVFVLFVAVGTVAAFRKIRTVTFREQVAKEVSLSKTRFLARMSHELRTPMNAVMGISTAEMQKDTHPAAVKESFRRIYHSSRLLLGIINDILDLAKVETGKIEILPVPYDTANMIADTLQLNLIYIEDKPTKFHLILDEQIPAQLLGDELRVKQILNNLLSNAFKYTAEGTVTLSIGMEKMENPEEIALIIIVKDTGQGLSLEEQSALFELEFTRFNRLENRLIEGSGLGMTITHSLINVMGGRIALESTQGKGSTFTVHIPQKIHNSEPLGAEVVKNLQSRRTLASYQQEMHPPVRTPMPHGKILFVDDIETNLDVMKVMLLPYELNVDVAESGEDALELIKSGRTYDIIFMDHMMPEMDGIETAQAMWDMGYNRPIVALTANATLGAEELYINAGFAGYITKPVDPDVLDECLKKFILAKK